MSKAIEEAKIEEVVADIPVEALAEEVIERPYSLRKLTDADLYPLLQLLRKLGVKDFYDSFNESKGSAKFNPADYENEEEKAKAFEKMRNETGLKIMFDMADLLISKICTHSDDIYAFFSNLAGVPAEDIKKMEFGTLPLMIYDAFGEVKNTAFFKVLIKLL